MNRSRIIFRSIFAVVEIFLSYASAVCAADTRPTLQSLQDQINQLKALVVPTPPTQQMQTNLTRCANSMAVQWGPCRYAIGDTGPAGGIVFYVTNNGAHGLEASPQNYTFGPWGCMGTSIPGARGAAVGAGAANTAAILAGCATAGIAARLATAYSLNDYNDWYLPSKDELNLMYTNLYLRNLGGFYAAFYWSSTESDANNAWYQFFSNGVQSVDTKNISYYNVRPIRAF